jgi:hypothetical protein
MVSYEDLIEKLPSEKVIKAVEKSPDGTVIASGKDYWWLTTRLVVSIHMARLTRVLFASLLS